MILLSSTVFSIDWVSNLTTIIVVFGCISVGLMIGYFSRIVNLQTDVYRFGIEPLCEWTYSAAEWRHYAEKYDLGAEPNGAARIKITPFDILIIDDLSQNRKELDASKKCVTDCRYKNNIFKIRVHGYTVSSRGGKGYFYSDYVLPVPAGKEREAAQTADFFISNLAKNPDKYIRVFPNDSTTGLFGETDF